MKYLPLGSVVMTARSTHPFMIIARMFKKPGKQEYFMTSLNNRVKKGILKMWFKKLRSLPEVPTGRKALQ